MRGGIAVSVELQAADLSQAGPGPAQPQLVLLNLFYQVNLLLDQYSTAGDRELSMTDFLVRIDLLELRPKHKAKAYHLIYIERPQPPNHHSQLYFIWPRGIQGN